MIKITFKFLLIDIILLILAVYGHIYHTSAYGIFYFSIWLLALISPIVFLFLVRKIQGRKIQKLFIAMLILLFIFVIVGIMKKTLDLPRHTGYESSTIPGLHKLPKT